MSRFYGSVCRSTEIYYQMIPLQRWNQFKVILLACALRTRNLPIFVTSDAGWRHGR